MPDLIKTTLLGPVPPCDLDPAHGRAYADASLPNNGGSWAYVCIECFNSNGCQLGLGKGQRLDDKV